MILEHSAAQEPFPPNCAGAEIPREFYRRPDEQQQRLLPYAQAQDVAQHEASVFENGLPIPSDSILR